MKTLWICAAILAAATAAYSAQDTYSDTGGKVTLNSTGTTLTISGATVASPAGTVSMSCSLAVLNPTSWSCKGGSLSLTDGSTTLTGSFTSGVFTVQKVTNGYVYALNANFAGSLTASGGTMAVFGSVVQDLAEVSSAISSTVSSTIQTGTIYASQRYEPLYIADTANNRIVSLWDIEGDTWTSFGAAGSGTNQFSHPWGIFVIPTGVTSTGVSGTIYVSDSGNCRIVSFTSTNGVMSGGANWRSFGSCGSGTGQFSNPEGIFVDTSTGHIYVADTGNNRVVRMDSGGNSTTLGGNFTTLGTLGSGTKQFNAPGGVALDSLGKIYVADTGNSRVVRVDDMTGTNWTTLTTGLSDPVGVWVDSSDRIYTTNSSYGSGYVVRVDDMTGANPASLGLTTLGYQFSGPRGVFVDPDGAVYVADAGYSRIVRTFDMNTTLSLGNEVPDEWTTYGALGTGSGKFSSPSGVFAVRVASQVPVPLLSTTAIAFPTQLVGTTSPARSASVLNIGTGPFTVNSITVTTTDYAGDTDFTETKNACVTSTGTPLTVTGGHSCYASAVFQPSAGNQHKGNMAFSMVNSLTRLPIPSNPVSLSGWGALVTVTCSGAPGTSCPPLITFEGGTGKVTVTNPLSTPTSVTVSISGSAFYISSNTCSGITLNPGNTCTVTENFNATPTVSGTLTVTDSSGTKQSVALLGE